MISQTYFSLCLILLTVFIWAVQAQTTGHVYLYVTVCLASVFSIRILLPHIWALLSLLLVWWGLSLTCLTTLSLSIVIWIVSLAVGRNVF